MEEKNNLPGNKVNISTQKMLGGIGALLILLGAVPGIGIPFPIVSGVLLIVSIYKISNMLKKPAIFNKFIIGFVLGIIGDILLFFFGLGSFMGGRINFWITLGPAYILSVVGFYFCKQAFDMLAKTINHKLFSTAGIIMFIGAITTIIFFLGGILLFASWIILAVAFFTAPEEVEVVG